MTRFKKAWKNITDGLQRFARPPRAYYLIFLVGVFTLSTRALLDSDFGHSALLYIGTPFLVSVLLHHFVPRSSRDTVTGHFLNHLLNGTIILFATSALLFEGFICVLFFLPIFYLVLILTYLAGLIEERSSPRSRGEFRSYALPVILVAMSFEGVVPPVTFERDSEATYSAVTDAGISALKRNMARPIAFDHDRHWSLAVFPLPVAVEAGSLGPGDVHTLHFVYRRWFFTNTHRGEMQLRLVEVGDSRVRTEVVKNTSYLANYLEITGTEVNFTELGSGSVRIELSVRYRRLLDPYWYFGPLQHFAVEQSAKYLIESVILRESNDG